MNTQTLKHGFLVAVLAASLSACGGSSGGGNDGGGGSANRAPVAVPGGPYASEINQVVQFDGSGSSDPDGDALTYAWDFGDGGTSTAAMPTHSYSAEGNFTVTLQVKDASVFSPTVSTSALITAPIGGITGTGFAKGIISDFGSVVVGGTHYVISNTTTITVDDNPGSTENELELGDYVEIHSTFNDDGITSTFTADNIVALESVEGPVDLPASVIDGPNTGTLQVLGQTVRVTPATILDNADFGVDGLDELVNGDYIEVHGLKRPDGSVDASQIERKDPLLTDVVELTGIIGTADPASDRFTINGLTITYTLAGLQDFGGREPQAGDLVEVKGTPAGLTAGPTLAADTVELKTQGLAGADDDRAEVEGYIVDCNGPPCDSFSIDGVSVQLASSVSYQPATFGQSDLSNNIKIEAEGSFSGGILIANKIEFKTDNNARIEAFVDSNSGTALIIMGATFNYDGNTDFEDKTGSPVGDITLVSNGHYVEARGDEDPLGSNEVQANRVKRDDPPGDGRMIIRAIADSKSSAPLEVSVLGVTVALTGATECRDLDDIPYPGGCSAFIDDVKAGISTVKARGVSFAGGVLTAEEIELEN